MLRFTKCIFAVLILCNTSYAQQTGSWGDQGNGTYINPVLNADYSDPDVIRVGKKYYMVCSEFHFMGMTIQESEDMVNWKIIGRIYNKIDLPGYDNFERYGAGSWAPALRHHDDKFWVYFCTRNEGLFMSNAENPEGPWSPLLHIKEVALWEDPCPFWDDDGKAYLGRSAVGAGPIYIHEMSQDGTKLLDDGKLIYTGPVAEGTKIHKRNGYYYMSIPEGGVKTGWQTILRSKNIYGPYEKKVVLETGMTGINGPHQGSLVETDKGEWWFYHFQYSGALGRVMHLQPMYWHDNWPVIGIDIDRNGIGEPVYVWEKPNIDGNYQIHAPQTDDRFDSEKLGLQWQWNHNPVNIHWSLMDKKGWLSLKALKAPELKFASNTLTQKVMGNEGEAIAELNTVDLINGQKAGLTSISGNRFISIGVLKRDGKLFLFFEEKNDIIEELPISKKKVYLKFNIDTESSNNRFYYSFDNNNYYPLGNQFEISWGAWKGSRIGLFSYNVIAEGGTAYFDNFHYNYDGPK